MIRIAEENDIHSERITVTRKKRSLGPNKRSLGAKSLGANPKLTLDRIDNGKGYSPDNVRWVDSVTQNLNTRRHTGRELPRGITWREARGEYQVYVTVAGKYRSLGYSADLAEAIALREAWDIANNVTPCSQT